MTAGSLTVAFALGAASPAAAHDTWLLPVRFALPSGARIEADLTSGMAFPRLESAVASDRLVAAALRVGSRTVRLEPASGTTALRLTAIAPAAGIAALWVAARWRRLQRGRETYSKLAKTYVRVGDGSDDRSWPEPVGLELEIVPLDDPTGVVAGHDLRLRILRARQPLAGFPLSAVAAGGREPIMRTTAEDGTVSFTLNRPGAWLLRGTLIEESAAPDADWKSLFTTLTVTVRPGP